MTHGQRIQRIYADNRTCRRCKGSFHIDEFRYRGANRSLFSDYCGPCRDERTGATDHASIADLRNLFEMDKPTMPRVRFSSLAAASQDHITQVRALRGGAPHKRWITT